MRPRAVLLILAILLVGGFAALNWDKFMAPSNLNFGLFTMDAPLGAVMLALLGLTLLLFLISSATMRSRMMITEHRYTKDLQAQRDLADRAEASRFTELRQYLDSHFRGDRQRDAVVSSEFEKNMLQSQRDMRTQLEQINHTLMARLGELETRFDSRFDRTGVVADVDPRPVDLPPRDRVKL